MKHGRCFLLLAVMVALPSLFVVGCGKDSTQPTVAGTPAPDSPNLDEPLGGYTSQSEVPNFGDADLAASSELESRTEDVFAADPEVVGWARSDSVRAYAVTLLWGILDADPSIHPGTDGNGALLVDWSGYAAVNHGTLVVRATIAFEGDDYIVGPRIEREKVMWVSHTSGGFDGIRLFVLQRLGPGQDGSTDSLTIQAGVHQWILPVNDLVDLDRTDAIDDLGNKFTIRSFQLMPQLCNRGFMGGAWLAPQAPGADGRFQGRWVASDGSVVGTLRGIWGINDQGEKVFFGKFVDRSGAFRGILRGTWVDRGPESPSQSSRLRTRGSFQGDWVDENGNSAGTVRGHWRAARDGEDGFFEGAWKEGSCAGL